MKYRIYTHYELFGTAMDDVTIAPDERALEAMLKSIKEFGMGLVKVEPVREE